MSDKCYMCGADATGTDSEGDICGPCYAVKLWQGDEKLSPKGVTNVWNYPLFRHMSETYQLTLVESELSDIVDVVRKMDRSEENRPIAETAVNTLKSEIASLKAELAWHETRVKQLEAALIIWKKNCEERSTEGGARLVQIMKLHEERDQWRIKARELLVEICEKEAPSGWRLLEVGEVIQEGDEFWSAKNWAWEKFQMAIGSQEMGGDGPSRRRMVKQNIDQQPNDRIS